ncbi:MAG: cobyrinate a,c-diamide synthase [Gammaproteobacteria bacterium]|nr:cobyrinate a,c-diamide synthase [Gammaproteobacteria bacterium]
MSRLLISAAHKSSGKTTVTLGLCAAIAARGLRVQPFKKGPDYIDPMWLGQAAGRPCHNLDFHCMSPEEILTSVGHYSSDADLALIEGNKGLYDGLDLHGSNSNAALAKLTHAPVILVLDARGMTRGIAPLILGNQAFDTDVQIAGVILNQLGGSRHEAKLRAVIEHYTEVPVLGGVHRDPDLAIDERHLGLVPSNEASAAGDRISVISARISEQVDIDRLLSLAGNDPLDFSPPPAGTPPAGRRVRIGIARDAAFGFYYPDDLAAMERAGAELVPFSTLRDTALPDIDGLFIGGGFPETRMAELEANRALRENIRTAIENGLPAYAECGGLMYLSRSLTWQDRRCSMAGVIPADTLMHEKPQGRGYVRLRERTPALWPGKPAADVIAAHEFHYSALVNPDRDMDYAYEVVRGTGIDGSHDGLMLYNLLACYSHMRDTAQHHWASRFVDFIRQISG